MDPFYEPMVGERTGISTATLVAVYGPICARGIQAEPSERFQIQDMEAQVLMRSFQRLQLIAFSIDLFFVSSYWPHRQLEVGVIVGGDTWLPWEPYYSHDVRRAARRLHIPLEVGPQGLLLLPLRRRQDRGPIETHRQAYGDAI